jgi:hypothetical protein
MDILVVVHGTKAAVPCLKIPRGMNEAIRLREFESLTDAGVEVIGAS